MVRVDRMLPPLLSLQTRSSRCLWVNTRPAWATSSASTPYSVGVSCTRRPARVTRRWA